MGAGNRTSLKGVGGLSKALFTTARLGRAVLQGGRRRLLVFGFKATGMALDVSTVRVISIVPQVTQLIFVWWMSRHPTSRPATASTTPRSL